MYYIWKQNRDAEEYVNIKNQKNLNEWSSIRYCKKNDTLYEPLEINLHTTEVIPDFFIVAPRITLISSAIQDILGENVADSVQFFDVILFQKAKEVKNYKILHILSCEKDVIDFEKTQVSRSSVRNMILSIKSLHLKEDLIISEIFRLYEFISPIIVSQKMKDLLSFSVETGAEFIETKDYCS